MIVYFSSSTGFTHRFVEKLGLPAERIPLKIKEAEVFTTNEEYVLVVPTYELPDAHGRNGGATSYLPRQVAVFLNQPNNRDKLCGVIGAGNRNFGEDFAIAADKISEKAGVPVLHRFELAGTDEDVRIITEGLEEYWETLRSARSRQLISTHS